MANTPVVVLDDTMTSIANAIRSKTGGSATMTPGQMPAQIMSIPSGGGVGIPREVSAQGVFQMPSQSFSFSLPANVTDVGDYAVYYGCRKATALTSVSGQVTAVSGSSAFDHAFESCTGLLTVSFPALRSITEGYAFNEAFKGCTALASIDLSSLEKIRGNYTAASMFANCTALTSVDLSHLTEVIGNQTATNMFSGCTNLQTVNLSSLEEATDNTNLGGAFLGCTSLTSINLAALKTIGGYTLNATFRNCKSLTSMSFPSLESINGNNALLAAFKGCTSLTLLSFPALTASSFGSYNSQFNDMLSGVTGCTVHFPAAIQSTIGSWASVTGGFGGTNTTVLFDL